MKISNLKPGSILSETSFYKVSRVEKNEVIVVDEAGNDITISKMYAEGILNSADQYSKEEKKTKTELADILLNNPRVAMTVEFYKADVAKTKKAFEAEKSAAITKIQNAKVSEVEKLLAELIENPITKTIPGELRVMKGRHEGHVDDLGRLSFTDMEQAKGTSHHDARLRQVDPRSIQAITVNDVRYTLK